MLIEKLIGDLLLRHNCVVVPGFGGFVARTATAKLDLASGVIYPPKKSLLFNKQLINNDGLLISTLANEQAISFTEAASQVEECVNSWNTSLFAGERITLDKVGFLFLDQEKNIGFEQDRHFNLLLNAYGLTAVNFISEQDIIASSAKDFSDEELVSFTLAGNSIPVVSDEKSENVSSDKAPEDFVLVAQPIRKLTTRRIVKYAAAVALIPLAFYTYWIPMKTPFLESGIVAIDDFNPFSTVQEGTYQKKTFTIQVDEALRDESNLESEIEKLDPSVQYYAFEFGDVFIPVKIRDNEIQTNETTQTEVSTELNSETGNMHYIVGCFSSVSNATNLVKTLKDAGLNAYIVDVVNGYHRVSCGRASSSSELKKLDSKIANLQVSPWILVK